MADKNIGSLPAVTALDDDSLLITEQQGKASSVRAMLLKNYARQGVDALVASALAAAEQAAKAAEESARAAEDALNQMGDDAAAAEASKTAAEEAATAAESAQAAAEKARDEAVAGAGGRAFIATYGVTTFAEIATAVAGGRPVEAVWPQGQLNRQYQLQTYSQAFGMYIFTSVDSDGNIYNVGVDSSDAWTSGSTTGGGGSEGEGATELFVAEYGRTTYSEVYEAVEAGKLVAVKHKQDYDTRLYYLNENLVSERTFLFVTHGNDGTVYKAKLTGSGWTSWIESYDLPAVDGSNNGYFLQVKSGEWQALPFDAKTLGLVTTPTYAEVGETLVVKAVDALGRPTEWTNGGVPGLPAVTTEDDGKFLRVIRGEWKVVSLTDVSEVGA